MSTIKVVRGNDLIFENGNELGELREPLYVASCGEVKGHGRTPDEAVASLKAGRRARLLNDGREPEGSTPD